MPISLNGNGQTSGVTSFDTDTLFIDETNNRIAISNSSPATKFHVSNGNLFNPGSSSSLTSIIGSGSYGGGVGLLDGSTLSGFYAQDAGRTVHMFVGKTDIDTSMSKIKLTVQSNDINSGGGVIINGSATNSGPARLELRSQGDATSFYNKEVFKVAVSSAQEISRLTTTGANGFQAYFKIIVTGHNGGIGNGANIKEFLWAGGTNAPTQISTITNGNVPNITFDNTTNNVCIIRLASSNGIATFQGTVMIEWLYPSDFSNNTGTIS